MPAEDLFPLLLVFILGIWLMWLLPKPCDHPECEKLHARLASADRLAARRRAAEDAHNQWHSRRNPDPDCEWCDATIRG